MEAVFRPLPPRPGPLVMQNLGFDIAQQQVAHEIFEHIGNVKTGVTDETGKELNMLDERMLYTRRIYPSVSWEAVYDWLLEDMFFGEITLAPRLREGVELVLCEGESAKTVARGFVIIAKS